MTQPVNRSSALPSAPWLRRFPLRTPTLPPATHTNCYAVGEGELALVDAASPYSDEQEALEAWLDERAAAGERPVALVCTHHHADHVGGVRRLAERHRLPVLAHAATAALLGDRIRVTRTVEDGEVLEFGGARLEALFTPGHAPGHLCFRDLASGAILAGDMVATIGTILIDPSEGDMGQYLASLARLRALRPSWLLPAHGEPVADADGLLAFYVAHRLAREAKVLAALRAAATAATPATLEALLPIAYADVAPEVYPLAARSLLAHLRKLAAEERAVEDEGRWRAA